MKAAWLAAMVADPRLTPDLVTSFGALTELLVFNPVVGSTTNVDVRRALSAATDRARIAGAALGDASFAATTFTAPPIFGAVPPSAGIGIGFDPAAALADRDAAGAA